MFFPSPPLDRTLESSYRTSLDTAYFPPTPLSLVPLAKRSPRRTLVALPLRPLFSFEIDLESFPDNFVLPRFPSPPPSPTWSRLNSKFLSSCLPFFSPGLPSFRLFFLKSKGTSLPGTHSSFFPFFPGIQVRAVIVVSVGPAPYPEIPSGPLPFSEVIPFRYHVLTLRSSFPPRKSNLPFFRLFKYVFLSLSPLRLPNSLFSCLSLF